MKKKIDIFGRKVPVLAVMMVLLVIGTASAALITNYATLSGTFAVGDTITVTGDDIENDLISFNADTGTGDFTITNVGDSETPVNIVVTLTLNSDDDELDGLVTNVAGITMTVSPVIVDTIPSIVELVNNGDVPGEYMPVEVLIPGDGFTNVIVDFNANPALEPGLYTIQVEVNPTPA